jgi:hypothetical protein
MDCSLSHRKRLVFCSLILCLLLGALPSSADGARRTLRYEFDENQITSYRFATSRTVSTEVAELPPEAARSGHRSVMNRIDSVESRLEGTLERFVAKSYRDGTLGVVSRLVGLSGTIGRDGESKPSAFPQLEGKSMAVRIHESGELLHSNGWPHFMGGGRGGELAQDVLLQSVLRLPRHLPKSVGEGNSFILRVPVDPSLERSETWMLRYLPAVPPEECGKHCYAISYRGELLEKSRDKHPARPMTRSGDGTVAGTLVLQGRGRAKRMLSHEWTLTWNREIKSHREDGRVRGRLLQQVSSSGSLELLGVEVGQ